MAATSVSVIIPTYNRADTIEEAVDSLLVQTHPNLEIIVVDDGSTDGTADRLERYGQRIRFVAKPNGGCATARNVGLEHASGRYVAWMDSDDICLPERIALQARALDSWRDAVLVSSDFTSIDSRGQELERSHSCSYYGASQRVGGTQKLYDAALEFENLSGHAIPLYVGDCYERLVWGNFIHPPTVMVRREALEKSGGFDPDLPHNAEYDCILRIARQGRCLYIDLPLLLYRYTDAQLSGSTTLWKVKENTARIMRKLMVEDTRLAQVAGSKIRRRIADNLADAAYLCADSYRDEAWRLLRRATNEGGVTRRVARAGIRLLAPAMAIETIRRWGRFRASSTKEARS